MTLTTQAEEMAARLHDKEEGHWQVRLEAAALIRQLVAALGEAERERDVWREGCQREMRRYSDLWNESGAKERAAEHALTAATQRAERLAGALEPFARVCDAFDYWAAIGRLTEDDFRAARQAYAEEGRDG